MLLIVERLSVAWAVDLRDDKAVDYILARLYLRVRYFSRSLSNNYLMSLNRTEEEVLELKSDSVLYALDSYEVRYNECKEYHCAPVSDSAPKAKVKTGVRNLRKAHIRRCGKSHDRLLVHNRLLIKKVAVRVCTVVTRCAVLRRSNVTV